MLKLKYAAILAICLTIFSSLAIFAGVQDDVPRPVRIRVKNTLDQPVANASVQIFPYGGTSPIGSVVTGSDGEALFQANPGNYYVRSIAYGYTTTEEPFSVAGGPITLDVYMEE